LNEELKALDKPTKWQGANARLLGSGHGLPIKPIDRLGLFSADEFECFVLERADGYLTKKGPLVTEVQQRGGSGDKGRDIVVWFGAPGSPDRYWHLYQCKRYGTTIGEGKAVAEIGKVLYFAWRGGLLLAQGVLVRHPQGRDQRSPRYFNRISRQYRYFGPCSSSGHCSVMYFEASWTESMLNVVPP
jgi:hypothetical protein